MEVRDPKHNSSFRGENVLFKRMTACAMIVPTLRKVESRHDGLLIETLQRFFPCVNMM